MIVISQEGGNKGTTTTMKEDHDDDNSNDNVMLLSRHDDDDDDDPERKRGGMAENHDENTTATTSSTKNKHHPKRERGPRLSRYEQKKKQKQKQKKQQQRNHSNDTKEMMDLKVVVPVDDEDPKTKHNKKNKTGEHEHDEDSTTTTTTTSRKVNDETDDPDKNYYKQKTDEMTVTQSGSCSTSTTTTEIDSNNNNNSGNTNDAERTTTKEKRKKKKKKKKTKSKKHTDEQQQQEETTNNADNDHNNNDNNNNADNNDEDKPNNNTVDDKDNHKSNGQSKEQERHATTVVAPDTTGHEDYRSTYVPTPLKPTNSSDSKHYGTKNKWFPNALTFKSVVHYDNFNRDKGNASILLFYQYKSPQVWTNDELHSIIKYLQAIFTNRPNLGGRIRVAPEGLNCTLSAGDWFVKDVDHEEASSSGSNTKKLKYSAAETLRHFTYDLQYFDKDFFADTDFKFHDNLEGDRHFKDFKILPVQELVFYDLSEQEAPLEKTGIHLEPNDFHAMLKGVQPKQGMDDFHNEQGSKISTAETVVIDVRNHYEAAIGRFDGQQHQDQTKKDDQSTNKPAMYVDPKMRKSTDFKGWLAKEETRESLKGKNVMLYCTGGVRCERASAYLNNLMGSQLQGVYQLQGGIERYMKEISPTESCWRGKNFVFDKREAVSATNLNGDGGVITQNVEQTTKTINTTDSKKKKKRKKNKQDDGDAHVDGSTNSGTVCCVCQCPWDRYIGKRKCSTCGVPVLMCHTCMSNTSSKKKKQTKDTKEGSTTTSTTTTTTLPATLIRCPLCVEENVTVPATEVQYTNNGIGISTKDDNTLIKMVDAKSAPTVLKWGGGHASGKKAERRFKKRRQCRFGSECTRGDCIFLHP